MWLKHILISCLIVFLSDFVSSNTCTVKVTGRNRSYDEVRETIVNEDWRDDVEDEIKRHKQRVRRAYYQRNRDFTVNALGPLENVYLNIYANLKYIKSGFGIATGTVHKDFQELEEKARLDSITITRTSKKDWHCCPSIR